MAYSIWGQRYMDNSDANKTPIILSIKESVMIEGAEFFPFVAYSTGKIYTSVLIEPDHRPAQYDIITASFTGLSKDQMKLFIRGTYHQRRKGSVGMFVEKSDLDLITLIIKEYNKTLGFDTIIHDPNILDKELFEI